MKGEKRLKEIQKRLIGVLGDVSPESVGKLEIQYKQIKGYYHDAIRAEMPVEKKDSPAYGFYLVPKDDPTRSYPIMHVFWPDIREKTPPHMEKYYGGSSFADRVREGAEELQKDNPKKKEKPSGLENLLIIFILIILISLSFMQSNLTGFAISNLSQNSIYWISLILLLIGLVVGFFWLKSSKK